MTFAHHRVWTPKEAEQKWKTLAADLEDINELMDKGLSRIKGRPVQIWSTMLQDERECVAKVLSKMATRSPEMAAALDIVQEEKLYIEFALIVGPRAWDTGALFVPHFGRGKKSAPVKGKVVDANPTR